MAAPCAPWHGVRGPVRKYGRVRPFNGIVRSHLGAMDANEIAGSVVGWAVMLGVAFWYVRRIKHPTRKSAKAFGIFVGVFGGIALVAISMFAWLWSQFMPENAKMPGGVGAFLALAVIIPAWNFAAGLIKRPTKEADQPKQNET